MERHRPRLPGRRSSRRVGLTLVALLQLCLPGAARADDVPGVDLDTSERALTLEERGCGTTSTAGPQCPELAAVLGRQGGRQVRSFNEVVATLPSKLRSDCDVKGDDIGWPAKWIRCFDEADTDQSEWLTQGLGGTGEWRTEESAGRRPRHPVAAGRGRATPRLAGPHHRRLHH